jgi:hypothetical protein
LVVLLYRLGELEVLDGVLMAAPDLGVVGKLRAHLDQRVVHLLGRALEEPPATACEDINNQRHVVKTQTPWWASLGSAGSRALTDEESVAAEQRPGRAIAASEEQDVASCVAWREEDLHVGATELQRLGVGDLVRQSRDWGEGTVT